MQPQQFIPLDPFASNFETDSRERCGTVVGIEEKNKILATVGEAIDAIGESTPGAQQKRSAKLDIGGVALNLDCRIVCHAGEHSDKASISFFGSHAIYAFPGVPNRVHPMAIALPEVADVMLREVKWMGPTGQEGANFVSAQYSFSKDALAKVRENIRASVQL